MGTILQLKQLAKSLPEIYQHIEIDGKVIVRGRRSCSSRWDLIKDRIKPHDVVFDIGSSLGYFSHKIAKTYPDSLVISFESDPAMCEIQRRIFEHEGIYNVVVCRHRLTGPELERWTKHAEFVDVGLMLSVLHHYPKENVAQVWEASKKLFSKIVIEIPDKDEDKACNPISVALANEAIYGQIGTIGRTKSHLGTWERRISVKNNDIDRRECDAYFGVGHFDRHTFTVTNDRLNNNHICKGVNLWNLAHFKPVWPNYDWFNKQSTVAYGSVIEPHDIRPWNLLVTSTGIKAIDFLDELDQRDEVADIQSWILRGMEPVWT